MRSCVGYELAADLRLHAFTVVAQVGSGSLSKSVERKIVGRGEPERVSYLPDQLGPEPLLLRGKDNGVRVREFAPEGCQHAPALVECAAGSQRGHSGAKPERRNYRTDSLGAIRGEETGIPRA